VERAQESRLGLAPGAATYFLRDLRQVTASPNLQVGCGGGVILQKREALGGGGVTDQQEKINANLAHSQTWLPHPKSDFLEHSLCF